MIYSFTGNGSCEGLYGAAAFEITDNVPAEKVQEFYDGWVKGLPDDNVDQFGDLDTSTMTFADVVAAMPKEWEAKIIGKNTGIIFV